MLVLLSGEIKKKLLNNIYLTTWLVWIDMCMGKYVKHFRSQNKELRALKYGRKDKAVA